MLSRLKIHIILVMDRLRCGACVARVTCIILLTRVGEKIEYGLRGEQAGVRRGKTTADMLVVVQILIEKTIQMDGQAFVVFIDDSKTFDSISQVHNV